MGIQAVQFPHARFVSVDTGLATQSRTAYSCKPLAASIEGQNNDKLKSK